MSQAAKKATPPPPPPRDLAIEMGAPFHDHAIIQREMKVPVWGWSAPGVEVTVAFAGQKKTARAGADGKWMLELDPLKASAESREMIIADSAGKIEVLKDILVGEVWMCSGQSNMQWEAGKCIVGLKLIPLIKARVEAGKEKMPIIREGKVTNKFSSLYPSCRVKGQWSKDWMGFSAIAFAFSYEIAREVGVPVGIVNCAFSTTTIQAWTPREGFAAGKDEYTKAIYRKILESDLTAQEHKAAWETYEKELSGWAEQSRDRVKKGLKPKDMPQVPGNMNGNRDATWMCNGKITPMAPYAIRGAIWNQGYASQGEGIVYRNNLHSMIRGWRSLWNNPDLPVYFHQFYSGKSGSTNFTLANYTAEMRLGTWLASKDIPNTAMASQIDIIGAVHYSEKAVPGKRLALHALKNQYPSTSLMAGGKAKDIVADGPMYRDYKVNGDTLILELDNADGLCVGQSHTVPGGFADPVVIENGAEKVQLFMLAGKDHVWHRAKCEIKGKDIVLTASGLKEPCGVAYGRNGVGSLPSIYNKEMLPLTPFIFYDHKLVVSGQWKLDEIKIPGFESLEMMTWPTECFQVAGEELDASSYGVEHENRRMWILAPQFTHNAVLQADVPIRFYGKGKPKSVVLVRFNGVEKTMTMGEEDEEWELTFPAMEASDKPLELYVSCKLDGVLLHDRELQNIVIGDVWYVASTDMKVAGGPGVPKSGPAPLAAWQGLNPQLRMLKSYGRTSEDMPTRFKLNASGDPISEAFPRWSPTVGMTKELAERIHAKTGKPVGIVVLDPGNESSIKAWAGFEALGKVKAWKKDYDELYPFYRPDAEAYVTMTEEYLKKWQEYWKNVKDPAFESGAMPLFPGPIPSETPATRIYNQSICAFSPGNFKAILCLTGKGFVAEDEGAAFGEQFSAMANSWKDAFSRGKEGIDQHFVYALPSKELAAKLSKPDGINGLSVAIEIKAWPEIVSKTVDKEKTYTLNDVLQKLIGDAVEKVYGPSAK